MTTVRLVCGATFWVAILAVSALAFSPVPAVAQSILNGSFETNTAGVTRFNQSNANVNALVSNITAFGGAEEIDIIHGGDFGLAPIDGDWKLGIHTQGIGGNFNFDAFSLTLSAPLVVGNAYDLSFFAEATGLANFNGFVEVGISASATDFGTSVFTSGVTSIFDWKQFTTTFVAPISGSFLTVRNILGVECYSGVDNFTLAPAAVAAAPEPAAGLLTLAILPFAGLVAPRGRIRAARWKR